MSDGFSERFVAGCMTGTSLDAIDVAVVRVRGLGLAMRAELMKFHTSDLGEIAMRLRSFASGEAMRAGEIAGMSRSFSEAIAGVIAWAAEGFRLDFASVHGQTVFHEPPVSWQLLTPAVIAEQLGCDVVSDLRAADLAAGGQGAPITPLSDFLMYSGDRSRAIVNLGGFVNITLLPALGSAGVDAVHGFDVCPCNLALDHVAREGFGCDFDAGGARALQAETEESMVAALLKRVVSQGESLGNASDWTAIASSTMARGVQAGVVARSICRAVAHGISARVPTGTDIYLAGGGALNGALVEELTRVRGVKPGMTADIGVPGPAREAASMALLGALCADGVAITLPAVTGCQSPAPLAGQWSRKP